MTTEEQALLCLQEKTRNVEKISTPNLVIWNETKCQQQEIDEPGKSACFPEGNWLGIDMGERLSLNPFLYLLSFEPQKYLTISKANEDNIVLKRKME